MNIWEILGIEPTDDMRMIKRAYAKKCKIYHPETHPEEFQLLHQSYKKALTMIRSDKEDEEYPEKVESEGYAIPKTSVDLIPMVKKIERLPIQIPVENKEPSEVEVRKKENKEYLEQLERLGEAHKRKEIPKDIHAYFGWMLENEFGQKPWKKYVFGKEFLDKQYDTEFIERFSDIYGEKLLKIKEEGKGATPLWVDIYLLIAYGCVFSRVNTIDIEERIYKRQLIRPLTNAWRISTSVLRCCKYLEENAELVGERFAFYIYRNILEILDEDIPDKERIKTWLQEGFKPYSTDYILEILHINDKAGYKLGEGEYRYQNMIMQSPAMYELVAYLLESERKNIEVFKGAFKEVCQTLEMNEELEILLLMLE